MVFIRQKIIKTVWICFNCTLSAMMAGALLGFKYCMMAGVVSIFISTLILHRKIDEALKPISDLTDVTKEIAEGNLDARACILDAENSKDIDRLSSNINFIAGSLQQYVDYFNGLAYKDAMTGLGNKAAYEICRDKINEEIRGGCSAFSVVVMDVNNLKKINDTLGHEQGDVLLKRVTVCIKRVFGKYPLFRVGGDEFCAVIKDKDPMRFIDELQAQVGEASNDDFNWFGVHYQIAAGAAVYDPLLYKSFDDVFVSADNAMYNNKKSLKGLI